MPDSIEQIRAIEFGESVHHLVQQKPSRFRPWVMQKNPTNSKMTTFPRLSKFELEKQSGRHIDTNALDIEWTNRVCFKGTYSGALWLDEEDAMEHIIQPMSEYQIAGRAALNRTSDDVILGGVLGSANQGEAGESAIALPAAQKVTTAGPLDLANPLAAQRIMRTDDLDIEPSQVVFAISPAALEDVLTQTDNVYRSRDFNPLAPLVTGSFAQYLGMTWVVTTRLPITGSTRHCAMWHRMGIGFCAWRLVDTSIDRRPDKNNLRQLLIKTHIGSVRKEDNLVVQVDVTE